MYRTTQKGFPMFSMSGTLVSRFPGCVEIQIFACVFKKEINKKTQPSILRLYKACHTSLVAVCVCVAFASAHLCACVPVDGPGGHVVRDVRRVCAPVPAGQLFGLQAEVPQRRGARAPRHPVEAEMARFNAVLRSGQLPGRLRALCGCGEERGETRAEYTGL